MDGAGAFEVISSASTLTAVTDPKRSPTEQRHEFPLNDKVLIARFTRTARRSPKWDLRYVRYFRYVRLV